MGRYNEPKIGLDHDLHLRFKAYCKRKGIRMRTRVAELIEREMATEVGDPAEVMNAGASTAHAAITGAPFWERKGRR